MMQINYFRDPSVGLSTYLRACLLFIVLFVVGCASTTEAGRAELPFDQASKSIPAFTVTDLRRQDELEGGVTESSGNRYEVIGDKTIKPSLQSRLVDQINLLVKERGENKMLEITRIRVSTSPDPRGVSVPDPVVSMPPGIEFFGRLIWRGIDHVTLGRNININIDGKFDGIEFSGRASGNYRSDVTQTINSLFPSALDEAVKDLSLKLDERKGQLAK